VFSQVIDGLGRPPRRAEMGADRPPPNCLTLMPVVTVKFLTVINGHVHGG
jgi:hypothetical protein